LKPANIKKFFGVSAKIVQSLFRAVIACPNQVIPISTQIPALLFFLVVAVDPRANGPEILG